MISIIDYETGNLRSVQNMLQYLGLESKIASTSDEIEDAEKLLLPGVGSFDYGMRKLADRGLIEVLNYKVKEQKIPVLGICLGAQLLTRGSEEGQIPGLGWIAADICRFDVTKLDKSLRIPHMGWSDTRFRTTSRLFAGVEKVPRYYYVHSYHIVCDKPEDELCHAHHGYDFVAGVEKENVLGVQFHPEKSHRFGMQLLTNFAVKY